MLNIQYSIFNPQSSIFCAWCSLSFLLAGQGEEPRPEQQGAEELSKAENAKSSSQMVVGDEEGSSQKWRGPGSVVSVGERSIAAVGDMMDSAPELAKVRFVLRVLKF